MSNLILNRENIGQLAIIPLSPNVPAIFAVNQLSRYTHARARFAHTSFQDKIHREFLPNLLHLYRFSFIGKGSVTRDDEQAGDFRQVRNDVLGDAVAEILLLGVAAHVVEWQNGD